MIGIGGDLSNSLDQLQILCRSWNDVARLEIGGEIATPLNVLQKIGKEVVEFLEKPSGEEAADVLICLLIWCDIQGLSLSSYVQRKMEINLTRQWEIKPDGTIQHKPE